MIIKLNPCYKYREIAGIHYLIPCMQDSKGSEKPVQLTDTAFWIWQQLKKGTEYNDIVESMIGEYDVDLKTSQRAVSGFIKMLIDQGMASRSGF